MQRKRQFIIFGISVLTVVLLFAGGHYRKWLHTRVWNNLVDSINMLNLSTEDRKLATWEDSYGVSMRLATQMRAQGLSGRLLLLPPSAYLHTRWNNEFPEPVVLYYYTGIRCTLADGEEGNNATAALVFEDNKLKVVPISSDRERDAIHHLYQQYQK